MPIEPTPIDPVPTPVPSSDDPDNFDARADATMTALPGAVSGMNAAALVTYNNALEVYTKATEISAAALVAADAAGLVATSTSTLTVGAGTKTIHFAAPKPSLAVAGYQVGIVLASDQSIRMLGNIATVVDSDDITVTVVSSGVSGSGTYSGPWLIISAAFLGTGATAAEIWAGTTDAAAITPKGIKDSNAAVTLAWASTVTPDLTAGWHRRMTASASFTLGAPTGAKVGDVLVIDGTNSAGSVVLAVNAAWQRSSLGVIGPGNAARWKIYGIVDEVDGSGVMTRGTYNVQRVSG